MSIRFRTLNENPGHAGTRTSKFPIRTRWQAEFSSRNVEFSVPLKDTEDGLRGFELKVADGYVLFLAVLVHEPIQVAIRRWRVGGLKMTASAAYYYAGLAFGIVLASMSVS